MNADLAMVKVYPCENGHKKEIYLLRVTLITSERVVYIMALGTCFQMYSGFLLLCILGMTPSNFSWEKYLKDTNAVAAPEHLFKEVNLCMFLTACCFYILVSFIRNCRSKVIVDNVI